MVDLTIPSKTSIIAELGNIHLHSKSSTESAVYDAFSAGADLVKIQCINPLTAYWATNEQHKRYEAFTWPIERYIDFFSSMNEKYGNRVFASTFDAMYVDALKAVMPYWKVAFRMRDDTPMIAKMLWTERPIFFSTRGKFYAHDSSTWFYKSDQFIPLYATEYMFDSKTETKIVQSFKAGSYKGLSINFGGSHAIRVAAHLAHRCRYIEAHVRGENAIGPDAAWSLTMKELEQLRLEVI